MILFFHDDNQLFIYGLIPFRNIALCTNERLNTGAHKK